jgi:O-antigen ligase
MTLDPESGYFRILIWDLALAQIGQSPITGYSFAPLNDYILDTTVDCVWLVEALRYGIPAIVLLAWANIAAIWPVRSRGPHDGEDFDRRMSLAFTIVLLLLVFSGITVHLWNYMWILWGLFIGIKASLRERAIAAASNE